MTKIQNFLSVMDDKDLHLISDGKGSGEFTGFIDTGCYVLNAALSGSIYGGMVDNKVVAIAGEEATGKTFIALGIAKYFLDKNPEGAVFLFETEGAITREMLTERGIDTDRVILGEPVTVQEFRHKAITAIDNYMKIKQNDRPPLLFILDSLGQLSTTKEMEDTAEGKETRDMSRAQVIKATFRVLNLRLARAKIPLIVTNHVYDAVGAYIPTKVMSGGSGLKYTASQILFLSKTKDKDGKDVQGVFIKFRIIKSRLTKENQMVTTKLSYKTGLDRYYGLLELAEKYELVKKLSNRYELPDGTKQYEKTIYADPEKFFTKELLDQIDLAAAKEFKYGDGEQSEHDDDIRDDDTEVRAE